MATGNRQQASGSRLSMIPPLKGARGMLKLKVLDHGARCMVQVVSYY